MSRVLVTGGAGFIGSHARQSNAILAALVVCVAAVAPYLSTADDYFVRDDFGVIGLLEQKPASSFPRWFVSSWMDDMFGEKLDEVRPFTALSYQLTALGGTAEPRAHHLLNIALHAATSVLVLVTARIVAGLSLPAAVFAGVVFAILPVQAETVAWIDGRVDSLPALFYIATFLAYARWRKGGGVSRPCYTTALFMFFVTLFSKQTAITLPATLMAFDALVERRPVQLSWQWIRPYLAFVAMTIAYLSLRYVLFGQAIRERQLSVEGFSYFGRLVVRHVSSVVAGDPGVSPIAVSAVLLVIAALLWIVGSEQHRNDGGRFVGTLLFFGPVWWLIAVAPILMAGYESPRHVYLASAGWAIVAAFALEVARAAAPAPGWRRFVTAAGVLLLACYAVRLLTIVGQWHTMAAVSQKVVKDIGAEALTASPGILLIVDAPLRSSEWSLPISLRPPFSPIDVTKRAFVVSLMPLHCCRARWFEDTRRTLRTWLARYPDAPVRALHWDPLTGELTRTTERDYPSMRKTLNELVTLDSAQSLDEAIFTLLNRLEPRQRRSRKDELEATTAVILGSLR